jgi:capsular exopolysaccharide synthesis family protein
VTEKGLNEERYDVVPGLRREWMIVVRRRRLVALGFFGAILGTTIYNYSLRPVYEGLAVVTIAETMATNRMARMSTEMTRLGILIERQRALIKSPELAARVAPSLSPRAQTELSHGPIGSWADRMRSEWARVTGAEGSGAPVDSVAALRSRLRVTGETKSTWLEIRFAAYDPAVAAEVANALMEQYLKDTEEANKLAVENSERVLGEQVEEKEQRLTEQLSGLRQLGGRSGLGDLEVRKAMLEREYRAFQEALVSAQTSRVGREARRREATQLKGGVAAIRSDPLIRAASSRVTELEDRERTLLATLGPEHPDVIVVREQLEGARQRLAQEMGALEQGADSEYQLALNEESRLKKNMARIQRELADVEKEALGYSLERRKFEASRSSIDTLVQRQANASTAIVDAQVLQSARPPAVPISPQRQRNFLYSLIGGLIGGLLLAWMAERFDDSVQSPEDVKEGLGLPFLGIVPLIRKLPQGSIAPAIADAKNGLADSLRVVRTNLIYGSAELRPKVLAFTSATPGEGKSTVAAGLAILFAQNKARVLLIDADMRRPTAHQLLNLAQSPGLSGMLAAEGPVTLAPRSGPVRGLDVLTAGAPQEHSAERLGSEAMKSVIAQARSRYDWVIIDSPPTLGLSDAAVISTLADGMVVVCSGDKTPRQAVRHVVDQLRAVRASVLGVVLNRVDLGRHSYYYGRYYSAYHGPDRHGGEKPGPATRETAVSSQS